MLVEISDEQARELQQYSDLSGVAIDQLVAEALGDFIECAITSRTECLTRKTGSA